MSTNFKIWTKFSFWTTLDRVAQVGYKVQGGNSPPPPNPQKNHSATRDYTPGGLKCFLIKCKILILPGWLSTYIFGILLRRWIKRVSRARTSRICIPRVDFCALWCTRGRPRMYGRRNFYRFPMRPGARIINATVNNAVVCTNRAAPTIRASGVICGFTISFFGGRVNCSKKRRALPYLIYSEGMVPQFSPSKFMYFPK